MSGLAAMQPDQTAQSAIAQSRALNHVRKHAEAITVLTRALGRDPANPDLVRELAYSLQWTDDIDAALKMSNRAIALDPANEWAHLLHSSALQSVGRDQDALHAAREAARLAPHSYEAHHTVFECQLRLRDAAAAKRSLSRIVELRPNDLHSHQAAGQLAMLEKRWPEAEAAFRRALAIDANDAQTLALLGTVLAPRKHGEDGLELIKSAIRTDPRSHFVGGLLFDEAKRRLRPVEVLCALVVMAAIFAAILVLGRSNSITRMGLAILIAVLGFIIGLVILPRFLIRTRLDTSMEAHYDSESKAATRQMLWGAAFFLGSFAFFSAPMLALSFIVNNQSPGFKVFAVLAFAGYLYLVGRVWRDKVGPWLRSSGRL